MSDKFAVPNLPGATGEREAETEEGSDSRDRTDLYRDDHLGVETEREEWDSDDDGETETEETDCNSRYGEETEEEDDDEDEEPSHPDAPASPDPDDDILQPQCIDPEQLIGIVTAAVESATEPLIAQIESQQQAIDALSTVVESIDLPQITQSTKRLDVLCNTLEPTLTKFYVQSTTLLNESAIFRRQRAIMNAFLARSSEPWRDAAVKEFCSAAETIDRHGSEIRIDGPNVRSRR